MSLKSFDYLCKNGHVTDFFDWDEQNPEEILCRCGEMAEKVWLRAPGISPDNLWMGVNTEIGYVTSKSQLRDIMTARGEKFYEPGLEKDAQRRAQEIKAADRAKCRQAIVDVWKDVEHPGRKMEVPKRTDLNKNPDQPIDIKMVDAKEDKIYAGGN